MAEFLIARQSIFDQNLEVFAYRMLVDRSQKEQGDGTEVEQALTLIILSTFLRSGLDRLFRGRPALTTVTRRCLLGQATPTHDIVLHFIEGLSHLMPKGKAILEIPYDIADDPNVFGVLQSPSRLGYHILLDDAVVRRPLSSLIALGNIVKLDAVSLGRYGLRERVSKLRKYRVQLLVDNVETYDDFRFCLDLDIDFFQGRFFFRPNVAQERDSQGMSSNLRSHHFQSLAESKNWTACQHARKAAGVADHGVGQGANVRTTRSPHERSQP